MADSNLTPEELIRIKQLADSATKAYEELEIRLASLDKKSKEYLDTLSIQTERQVEAASANLKLLENFDKFDDMLDSIGKKIDRNNLREQAYQKSLNDTITEVQDYEELRRLGLVFSAEEEEKYISLLEKREQLQTNINDLNKSTQELTETQTNLISQQEEITAQGKERYEQIQKEILATNDLKKATDSLTASLSEHMRNKAGINKGYVDFINVTGKAGGVTGMMNSLIQSQAASFKEVLSPINLVSSAIAYAIENFQQFYNTLAKIGREAGTTVASGFNAAYASGARLGIDMGAQVATANALANSFVNLGNKEREQTTELLIASYEMQRFGIGANESVTILSGFQRSLGLSSEESAKLATELVSTARGLGLTSDAVKGLANNMEQFIAYGSQANQVMKETLAVSSQFGIGTDAIAKMSTKLDSLEGSITAANTIARELGVALDPLQLLRANPAEKMQMVADAIERSGFEGENARFKIQVLADQLGLTASQVQALTKQTEQSTGMLGDFEKGIRDLEASLGEIGGSLDGLEQIKIFFQNIGAPLMSFLGLINGILGVIFSLVNGLIAWADEQSVVGGWLLKLVLFLGIAKLAIGGFGGMISWLTGIIGTGLSKALAATGAGFSSMITSMGTAAQASAAGVGPLLAFGFAILMIGAGIGAAAWGMSKFVAAFKGFTFGEIMAISVAILALAAAMAGTIYVLGLMNNPVGWAGIAMLYAFAGALFIMGISLKSITDSFKTFNDSMAKNTVLSDFASALKEIANIDIQSPIIKIKAVFESFSGVEGLAVTKEKVAAMADITHNLQIYSQAVKTFQEAGGPTAAQVMTEKFVESMTTISEKITTQTTAASGGGMAGGGNITIVLDDVVIMKGKLKNIMDDNAAEKLTGG